MSRNVHPTEAGAQDMTNEQTIDTLYESPHFQETPMAAQIENAGAVMMEAGEATTGQDGCYWKASADHLKFNGSSSARKNVPDFERLDGSVEEDGLSEDFFLATEERIKGEQQERKRQREKALAAESAGLSDKRAERCREEVTSEDRYYKSSRDSQGEPVSAVRTTKENAERQAKVAAGEIESDDGTLDGTVSKFQPVATGDAGTVEVEAADPREGMDSETLAKVNECATRVATRFEDEPTVGRATIAKMIARRVDKGEDAFSAMMTVKDRIGKFEGVRQELAEINPYEQQEATVEVTVEQLWDPKHGSQRQVGLVSDDSGERVKFTVWKAAGDKPLVYEGDTIRVERAKVNAYQGDTTLAVAGDTEIWTVDEGKRGELPERHGTQKDGYEPPAWSADSDTHAWAKKRSHTVDGEEPSISEARAKAVNEWAMGRITEDEIDDYEQSVAEE